MFLQSFNFLGSLQFFSARKNHSFSGNPRIPSYLPLRCASKLGCPSTDVAGIFQNKVLIAAAASAAIGQLSKPITSTVFYGKNFDIKKALHSGGFPSTHSSAVVATATSLGLERGFSDPIFGLAVVYAALLMYDAQGVRREVGVHAKELNKVLLSARMNSTSSTKNGGELTNSFSEESPPDLERIDPRFFEERISSQTKQPNASPLLKSARRIKTAFIKSSGVESNVGEESVSVAYASSTLKESVGHTEIEVIAGAVLGFLVSLAVCRHV